VTAFSRSADLATWVGGQFKAVRGLLPAWRSKSGSTTVAVALGTPTDVTVTWDTPLADANYWCWVQPTGTTGASTQVAAAVKSKTATGCVVTLRPAVALAAGYTFTAYAVRLPGGAANA
jgi:hypothetical protein